MSDSGVQWWGERERGRTGLDGAANSALERWGEVHGAPGGFLDHLRVHCSTINQSNVVERNWQSGAIKRTKDLVGFSKAEYMMILGHQLFVCF